MHSISLAIAEEGTIGAGILLHPVTITKKLEAFFPHSHKVVLVDIPLVKVAANTGAGRYETVYQDRADSDTGTATKKNVAHCVFVVEQKTLTC